MAKIWINPAFKDKIQSVTPEVKKEEKPVTKDKEEEKQNPKKRKIIKKIP